MQRNTKKARDLLIARNLWCYLRLFALFCGELYFRSQASHVMEETTLSYQNPGLRPPKNKKIKKKLGIFYQIVYNIIEE